MNVLIINIDSTLPNIALKKIELYHKNAGDTIMLDVPMMYQYADKIYASCVFTKNKEEALYWESVGANVGGTGYDLHKKLPEEIDSMKPKINYGFTTRGCIRKCSFCFVPEKEGLIHPVGDIYDIWDGKSKKLVIMDNNILAAPKHFELICQQLIKEKITVDFNQGLDHRLLNEKNAAMLRTIRHVDYHFAFDDINEMPTVVSAIKLLLKHNIKRSTWYVLVGFNSSIEDDFIRLEYLKSQGQNAYVMRYETVRGIKEYSDMAAWANQHHIFHKMTFNEFIIKRYERNQKYNDDEIVLF